MALYDHTRLGIHRRTPAETCAAEQRASETRVWRGGPILVEGFPRKKSKSWVPCRRQRQRSGPTDSLRRKPKKILQTAQRLICFGTNSSKHVIGARDIKALA